MRLDRRRFAVEIGDVMVADQTDGDKGQRTPRP
jgi:hypothetical protein